MTENMFNLKIRSRHPSHNFLRRNKKLRFPQRVVYRLGSTTETKTIREINSIESIKTSSNKLKMKRAFVENNVSSPEFYTKSSLPFDIKYPLVAKKVYGSRGKGMLLFNTEDELSTFLRKNKSGYYFEQYFNGAREYRLHVTELGCFYASRKLRKKDAKDRWYFNSNNCIWANEYEVIEENDIKTLDYDSPNKLFNKPDNWEEVIKESQKALKAVGLDIGAIDVRMSKTGIIKILETNSAPSMKNIAAEMYLKHLPKIIKSKYNL